MPHDDDSLMINSQMRALYEKAIASLEDGSQFAEYTIVRLLGRGGMGAVYEARHVTLERSYAIKVLPYEFMARRDALERFENEARVMANLEHPNIVRVDDFRQTQGLYWLRMELARGDGSGAVSLQDLADRNGGKIDQVLLLALMKDVLKGVGYAHEKGVIHRDLKPANILLFPKPGGGLTAKVADYGLVKLLGDEFLRSRVTHSVKMSMGGHVPEDKQGTSTRALLGTWEYMSPEQQKGRMVDERTDLYAIGLMIFRMLTGEKPGLQLITQINPHLAEEWNSFLMTALENNPDDRFQDAGSMQQSINQIRIIKLAGDQSRDNTIRNLNISEYEQPEYLTDSVIQKMARQQARVSQNRKKMVIAGCIVGFIFLVILMGYWLNAGSGKQPLSEESTGKVMEKLAITSPDVPWTGARHGQDRIIDLGKGIRLHLVYLQGGSFQMGSPAGESGHNQNEEPVHTVILDGFWNGKYEVTQEQFEGLLNANPSTFKAAQLPVTNVSWNDAMEFCREVSRVTGQPCTLPTEAQWEYACRAGTTTKFHFGDSDLRLVDYAWFNGNAANRTHPVGTKLPNDWGLHDMHGNVEEWCLDWYDYNFYKKSPKKNPKGPVKGVYRTVRGGSGTKLHNKCRSAERWIAGPESRNAFSGFRIAINSV